MATKDQYLALNNKKNGINSINPQFQNLNLNQSGQYLVGDTVSSRVGIYDNKKVQNYIEEKQRKECSLWNKKDLNSRSLLNNFDQQEIEKEKSNIGSSSTLSLHITAYENANNTSNTTLKNADLIKKCKDAKQIFKNTTLLNGFELPRQQENDPPTPEVMKFKSTKKMANINQASATTQATTNSNRTGATAKIQSQNGKEAETSGKNAASSKTSEAKAKNVQASPTKTQSSITPATKQLQDDDAADPKAIRERRFQYNNFFTLTPNGMLYRPVAIPSLNQISPELTALNEKTNEIQALIKKKEYLSRGTFGYVNFCKIKGVNPLLIQKTLKMINGDVEEISAELNVYSQISSPFFPALFYAGFYNESYILILERVTGGTIADHLDNIKFNDVAFIAFEIAQGLKELHDRNLTHGDLKGNNIALTADGHIKLIDFGLSRSISTPTVLPHTPLEAPEVRDGHKAGAPADIYSFGRVVLAIMRKGDMAFDFDKMDNGTLALNFLVKCLKNDPEERIKNPLTDPFLQLQNPKPSYKPGVFVQKKQQPNNEKEDAKEIFGIQAVTRGEILKRSLIRFPSAKTLRAFK